MGASRDDIFQKALSLRESDKAELMGILIRSVESDIEEGAAEAWRVEIQRRAKQIESGAVQSIPWEVVRERLNRASRG